jgi:formate dehydrogenase subunit delta
VDIDHLVMMANDISKYFAGYPSHDEAVIAVEHHLRHFWEPRMRRDLVDYAARGGDGLKPLVREAIELMTRQTRPEPEDTND